MTGAVSWRRAWLITFGLLMLLSTLWSLATPLSSPADENEHLVRAALVARGHLTGTALPGPRTPYLEVTAPKTDAEALDHSFCYVFDVDRPAGCQPKFSSSRSPVTTRIYVGRYQPIYYGIVGLPTLVFSNPLGFYAARLLSAALVDALLAYAFVMAWTKGSRLMLGGTAVAVTPMVLYLSATLSPSALEIDAAIAFWTSLVLLRTTREVARSVVVGLGLSGVALAIARPPSPLWALVAIACVVPLGITRRRMAALLRRVDLLIAAAAVAVAALASLAWTVVEHATEVLPAPLPPPHASTIDIAHVSIDQVGSYTHEAIGVFSLNVPAPRLVTLAWGVTVLAIVVIGSIRTDRRGRAVVLCTLVSAAVVPTVTVILSARSHGYIGFGRYFIPVYAGVPLVAGAVSDGGHRRGVTLVRVIVWLLGAAQIVAYVWCLRRFLVGSDGPLSPWSSVPGGWDPPLPGAVLDVAFAAVVAAAGLVLHRCCRPDANAAADA